MAQDWEYAALAANVYGNTADDPRNLRYIPEGFTAGAPLTFEIDAQRSHQNGFFGRVYTSDDGNEVVLSIRGTDQPKVDFANSAVIALGIPEGNPFLETQVLTALQYALELQAKAEAEGKVFKVVGHSLGGGLAGIVSAALDIEGHGFDAAPFQNYVSGSFYSDIIAFGLTNLVKRKVPELLEELAGHFGDWVFEDLPPVFGLIDHTDNLFNNFHSYYMDGEFLHDIGFLAGIFLPSIAVPFVTQHELIYRVNDNGVLPLDARDLHSMDLLALVMKTDSINRGGAGGEWSERHFGGEDGLLYLNEDLREIFFGDKSFISVKLEDGEPDWNGLFRVWASDIELYKASYDMIHSETGTLYQSRAGEPEDHNLSTALLKLGLSVLRDGIVDGVATDQAKNAWRLEGRPDLIQLDLTQIIPENSNLLRNGKPDGSNDLGLWVWDTVETQFYGGVAMGAENGVVENLFGGVSRAVVEDGSWSIADYRFVTLSSGPSLEFIPAGGPDSEFNPEDPFHHDNLIIGGHGGNILEGGAGDDILIGGDGDDDFYLSPGVDIIVSGLGQDRFFVSPDAGGSYTIFGENSPDIEPDLLIFGEEFSDLDLTITSVPTDQAAFRGIHAVIEGLADFSLYDVNTIALAEGVNNVKLPDDQAFAGLHLKYLGNNATIELVHNEVTDPSENGESGVRLVEHEFNADTAIEEGRQTFSIADGYNEEIRPNDIITLDGENQLFGGVGFDFDKFDWEHVYGGRYYPSFFGREAGYNQVLETTALNNAAFETYLNIEVQGSKLIASAASFAAITPVGAALGVAGLGVGIGVTGLWLHSVALMEHARFLNAYEDATTRRYFGLHGEEYILGALNEDGSRTLTIIVDPQDTLAHQEFVIENWRDGDFGIQILQQEYQQGYDTKKETVRDGKLLVDGHEDPLEDDLGEVWFSDEWIRKQMLRHEEFGSLPTSTTSPIDPVPANPFDTVQSLSTQSAQTTSETELTGLVRQGNSANNVLGGSADDDLFFGADGDDTLYGYEGRDIYVFAQGNGADTIVDASSEGGIIRFRHGVDLASVTFEEVPGDDGETDYLITYGAGDTILIKDWSTLDQAAKDAWIFEQLDAPEEQPSHYSEVPDRSDPTPVLVGTEGDDFLSGTDRGEIMQGNGGDDELGGGGGADIISGGTGSDTIFGGGGRDDISGQSGDDLLFGGVGRDTLNGGSGSDRYHFNLGDGIDTIYDTTGGSPLDTDVLVFGLGIAPSDILITRNPHNTDLMILTIETTGEKVVLADQYVGESSSGSVGIERVEFADGSVWTRKDMQDIYLTQNKTDGDDVLVGSEADEVIDAGAGDDHMAGGGGADDYIWSRGDGNDRISDVPETGEDGSANRLLFGEGITSSDITIERPSGSASLLLSISGSDGGSVLLDFFFAGDGIGVDKIVFADGEVWTRDEVYALSIQAQTTEGNDRAYGTTRNDVIDLGAGDDQVDISGGNDILIGGAGNDQLGTENFTINYTSDTLIGGSGNDRLFGGFGSDTYIFGADFGHDEMKEFRHEEADPSENKLVFTAHTLDDFTYKATGLDGLDLLIQSADGSESIYIENFNQNHFVWVDGETVEIRWQTVGSFEFADGQIVSSAQISAIADVSGDVPSGLTGTEASETLVGGDGRDRLVGAGGDDELSGGEGGDYILGGDGEDTISGGSGGDLITGGADNDDINAGDGDDLVYGEHGDDIITGGEGNDFLNGGSGNDVLSGNEGDDQLQGELGTDILSGGAGDDRLDGGSGEDDLTGGLGNDTTIGNGGSDTYHYNFNDGQDVIDAGTGREAGDIETLILGPGLTPEMMRSSFSGRDLIIKFANGTADQLTLKGFLGAGELSEIQFADGTTMTGQELLTWATGASPDDDPLAASVAANNPALQIQYGGQGSDFLASLNSHTYYVFGRGDGQDQMYAREGSIFLGQPYEHELIIRGYRSDEVVLSRIGAENDDLLISFTSGDDTMRVINHFGFAGVYHDDRIDQIRFADNVVWTEQKIAQVIAETEGTGTSLEEVLESTSEDETLAGAAGSDTYIYDLGDGSDVIDESEPDEGATDVLAFGANIAPQDIVVARDGDDLILTLPDGETITLTGQLTGLGIEQVRFESGDIWDRSDLVSQMASALATDGNDTLTGLDGDELLNGGAGDDTLAGGAGGDTYTYALGDGSDTISENASAGRDRLVFDASIDSQATVLRRDPNAPDDLLVDLEDGATIRVTDQFADGGVEEVRFADGTIIARDTIEVRAFQGSQSDGDDVVIGTDHQDIIRGGTGNDLIDGGAGPDIYSYAAGDGVDRIADSGAGMEDSVVFQYGIASDELVLARVADDLVITFIGSPGDELTVEDHFGAHALSGILFADGTFWATDEITHRAETGLPPADGGSEPMIVPPSGPLEPQVASEDEAFVYDVPADVFADLSAVTVTLADESPLPAWLSYSNGQLSGTPSAEDATVLELTLSGTGTGGTPISETLFLGVLPVNDAPIAQGSVADVEVIENDTINVDLSTSDFTDEDDALLYKTIEMVDGSALPGWLVFDPETMTLSGTPPLSTVSVTEGIKTYELRLIAEDDIGLSTSLDFELRVQAKDPTQVFNGTDGDDQIIGSNSADIFTGGLGNDVYRGDGGRNIYVFNQGDGSDIIIRSGSTSSRDDAVGGTIRLGEGIAPEDLILSRSGSIDTENYRSYQSGLSISFANTPDDQIQVIDQFHELEGGLSTISRIEFADGIIWSDADILEAMPEQSGEIVGSGFDETLTGTAADETLYGLYGDDTLDGGAGNDLLYGGPGDDTYLFGYGSGEDRIVDFRSSFEATISFDTLRFGPGISVDDLTFELSNIALGGFGSNPLRAALTIGLQGSAGDTLILTDQYLFHEGNSFGIDLFEFDDGTSLTAVELDAFFLGDGLREGTDEADILVGTFFDERFVGGLGDDLLQGGLGNDTYVWAPGDGDDEIEEDDAIKSFDILELAGGITADDIEMFRGGGNQSPDLYVRYLPTGELIHIDNQFEVDLDNIGPETDEERFTLVPVIEEIRFSDGNSWNYDYIRAYTMTGTDEDQRIVGYEFQNDILDGKGGDDELWGHGGNDTYIFGRGSGNDTIVEFGPINFSLSDLNTIRFTGDIDLDDITIERSVESAAFSPLGHVIRLKGTDDSLTIDANFSANNMAFQFEFENSGRVLSADEISDFYVDNVGTGGDDSYHSIRDQDFAAYGDQIYLGDGDDAAYLNPGDFVNGGEGSDTYYYNLNFGDVWIRDEGSDTDIDRLIIDNRGIGNVVVATDTNGRDLHVKFSASGDPITLLDTAIAGSGYGIEELVISGGVTLDADWLRANATASAASQNVLSGTDGAETLSGGGSSDTTFVGGLGDDVLRGGASASDHYIWRSGDGNDQIRDIRADNLEDKDTLTLQGVSIADVELRLSGANLLVHHIPTGETITVLDQFRSATNSNRYGIEEIIFDDGRYHGRIEIDLATRIIGTDAANTLTGSVWSNVFIGGLGNDTLRSGDSGDGREDFYIYSAGDGNDWIYDSGSSFDIVDTLVLSDIDSSDIQLSRNGYDMGVRILSTGQIIMVDNQFRWSSLSTGIERIEFADGTVLEGRDTFKSMVHLIAGSGNDTITGTSGDDVLVGNEGNDVLRGEGGNDDYHFALGDGADRIEENVNRTGYERIIFAAGIVEEDVVLTKNGASVDLIITYGDGDVITVTQHLSRVDSGIDEIVFDSGTVWDRAEITQRLIPATEGDDTIIGTPLNDVLYGNGGDDLLQGLVGADTYQYALGDGNDVIRDGGTDPFEIDILQFGPGILPDDVSVSRVGDDIVLTIISTGETVTLENRLTDVLGSADTVAFDNGTFWDYQILLELSDTEAANIAPDAADDVATTGYNTPYVFDMSDLLVNDTDADGDTLTVTSVGAASGGFVEIDGSTVTFTPTDGFVGTAELFYTISDGRGAADIANLLIAVGGSGALPVANDDVASVTEDGTVLIDVLANDTDADGDTLSIVSVATAANGIAVIENGQLRYTPNANFNGTEVLSYTVGDGNGGQSTASVSVNVTPVNDAPNAVADVASVVEDGTVLIDVLANDIDIDGDTLSIVSAGGATNGTVVIENGQLRYTPNTGFSGNETLSYTTQDGQGDSATATVTLTVTPANDAPVAVADVASVAEDGTILIDVLTNDTDADGDTLSIVSVEGAVNGTVAIEGGQLRYTPNANFNGIELLSYTVGDGNGGQSTASVSVNVTPVNDAPTTVAEAINVVEDGTVLIDVLANDIDIDGDTLNIVSVDGATNGVVSIENGQLRYTPNANFNGSEVLSYTVDDGNGGQSTASVSVDVTPVNDAPTAIDDSATLAEDSTILIDVLANDSDADGDTLSITSVSGAVNGTVAIEGDQLRYTPNANFNGTELLNYTVEDGSGGSVVASISVAITPVNDAPVSVGEATNVAEGEQIEIDVLANDTDVDGDPLSISSLAGQAVSIGDIVTLASGARVEVLASGLRFDQNGVFAALNDGQTAVENIAYSVSDGAGGTSDAVLSVAIDGADDIVVADTLDFNDPANVVTGFGGNQDRGNFSISPDGTAITLTNNAWKDVSQDITITADTILRFDYRSDALGEIHGIAFDTNEGISSSLTFQIEGTQNWGIQSYADQYSGNGAYQFYEIAVGQFYTGNFNKIVFVMDDDQNLGADASFANIELINVEGPDPTTEFLNLNGLSAYGAGQDNGDVSVSPDSQTATLTNNAWKSVATNVTITSDTVIRFDFSSDVEGEIHGIGFDTNDFLSEQFMFQLSGTQGWGIQDYADQYTTGDGQQAFEIAVGQHFTGDFDRLVLIMDDDANNGGDSVFTNIEIL